MPRGPVLVEGRIIPRDIHGIVVYQTAEENRKLNLVEYSWFGVFFLGIGLGLVYLEQWGSLQARSSEEESDYAEDRGYTLPAHLPGKLARNPETPSSPSIR